MIAMSLSIHPLEASDALDRYPSPVEITPRDPAIEPQPIDSRISPETGSPNLWSLSPDFIRATFPMSDIAMKRVVTLFQESCVERIERIRGGFARHDTVEIARDLHALKGSISMFASTLTVDLLSNIEFEVKQGTLLRAENLLKTLEVAIDCLQPTLDQLVKVSV
jgi:HPt (histidine-containing phosphotransfer) domain-containing protein